MEEIGVAALASSDAHRAEDVGKAFTTFEGTTAADVRRAIEARQTEWEGTKHSWPGQVDDLRPPARQVRDRQLVTTCVAVVRRDGTGRDLGYPGGRQRPPKLELDEA